MYDIYCKTLNQLQYLKQQKSKSIAIGTGHVWWELFLKDVFSYYQNNQSEINLTFEVGNHLRLMDLLLSNEIDFFIGHEIKGLSAQKGLKFIPLFSCEDTFYASANHELMSQIVNEEDINKFPILELTPVDNRYRHLIEEQHPNRKKPDELAWQNQAKLTTNSLVTALDMLSLSNAIMRNYPMNMAQYFSKFNVMPLKLSFSLKKNIVGIYLLRELNNPPLINQFIGNIKAVIKYSPHKIQIPRTLKPK